MNRTSLCKILIVISMNLFVACGNMASSGPGEEALEDSQEQAKPGPIPVGVKPIFAKLFIETSMSMDGYDEPTKGVNDLRVFIAQMLNKLNAAGLGDSKVFVVNDKVYSHSQQTVSQLATTSHSIFDKSRGIRTKTDFKAIFLEISNNLQANEIGILFSDLIISKPETQYTNDLLKEDIEAYFKPIKDKKISTLIVKLNVSFSGKYYYEYLPHSGKLNPEQYTGKRPVYAVFFIPDPIIKDFLEQSKFHQMRIAILNNVIFSNSILYTNKGNLGNFNYSIDEAKSTTSDVIVEEDPKYTTENNEIRGVYARTFANEPLRIVIKGSFKNFVFDKNEISDIRSYNTISPIDGFVMEKINLEPTLEANGNVGIEFILKATKKGSGNREVAVKLKEKFPPNWIEATHSNKDSPVNANAPFKYQTYLFKGFTAGILSSYGIEQKEREIIKINIKPH